MVHLSLGFSHLSKINLVKKKTQGFQASWADEFEPSSLGKSKGKMIWTLWRSDWAKLLVCERILLKGLKKEKVVVNICTTSFVDKWTKVLSLTWKVERKLWIQQSVDITSCKFDLKNFKREVSVSKENVEFFFILYFKITRKFFFFNSEKILQKYF